MSANYLHNQANFLDAQDYKHNRVLKKIDNGIKINVSNNVIVKYSI